MNTTSLGPPRSSRACNAASAAAFSASAATFFSRFFLRGQLVDLLLGLLQLGQDLRGDLRWGVLLAVDLDMRVAVAGLDDVVRKALRGLGDLREAVTDEALDREQRPLRIHDRLASRDLTDQDLVIVAEGDDGRRRTDNGRPTTDSRMMAII